MSDGDGIVSGEDQLTQLDFHFEESPTVSDDHSISDYDKVYLKNGSRADPDENDAQQFIEMSFRDLVDQKRDS